MLFLANRRATRSRAILAALWSSIGVTYPTNIANNEDRAITWGGGARTITAVSGSGGTLYYRIDGASWIAYSSGFSLTSGQTVAWRIQFGGNESAQTNVYVQGVLLSSFNSSASGFP